MTYVSYVPSPPLNTYISDLYYLDGPTPYLRQMVIPRPSLHLMVNFGSAFQVHISGQSNPIATCAESWWVGIWSTYHIVNWPPNTQFFGVHFKPSGAYPFLQLPLSELHNQVVMLDAVWGQFAAEIRERLYAAPTLQAGFALFEQLLLTRLGEAPHGHNVVQHAVEQIARHHGALSIRALSDNIGISQNHLLTQFKWMIGVPPKELARSYRLDHVFGLIDPTRPVEWGEIAHQSGYYDQSHLNKDFEVYTGHNPTDYLRLRRQVYADDPEREQYIRNLPID